MVGRGTGPHHTGRRVADAVGLVQRIYTRDRSEYGLLHALQDAIVVAPVEQWLRGARTFADIDLSAYELSGVRATTDPLRFFELTNAYLAVNPPPARDEGLVALFRDTGLGPGATLPDDPTLRSAIVTGARQAQLALDAVLSSLPSHGGWRLPDPHAARSDGPVLQRAATQLTQMGLQPLSEAVYFFSYTDAAGEQLHGERGAVLHFPAGALPPCQPLGFWSLTMYDERSLLVPNEIDRYVIRPDTLGLEYDPDGALTVHLHRDRPDGVPSGNWLPAPDGPFTVALRAYLPSRPILDGTWLPPALRPSRSRNDRT
jgi:hypothetical protein